MKTGKWNYTEDITYRVVIATLHPVVDPVLSWQNAFAGQHRELVEITVPAQGGHTPHMFWIDNADGSGLNKIANGGGPDMPSRHVSASQMTILYELPEEAWSAWNPFKAEHVAYNIDLWQKENHPEQWERLQQLKDAFHKTRFLPQSRSNDCSKCGKPGLTTYFPDKVQGWMCWDCLNSEPTGSDKGAQQNER